MACEIHVDTVTPEEWLQLAEQFYDNNIYQTWVYQHVRSKKEKQDIKRVIIKDNDDIIMMFQMRIQKIPLTGIKIGYVQFGPLMLRKDGKIDSLPEALRLAGELCRQGVVNVLRINPLIYDDERGKKISEIIDKSIIHKVNHVPSYHTMRVSLMESEEEIWSRCHKKWRKELKRAEGKNIQTKVDTSDEFFKILNDLYDLAKKRKGFTGVDEELFRDMQKLLPDADKVKIVIAYHDEKPVTAHATSHFGGIAMPLIAANNETGLELGSAYIVWKEVLTQAKALGMDYYDLGGIDKEINPSVYLFKKHMGSEEISFIGAFEICSNYFVQLLWHGVEKIYTIIKK